MNYNEKEYPFKKGNEQLYFYFISNPKDKSYRELLDLMFDLADTFILVERDGMVRNDTVSLFLEEISSYKIVTKDQSAFAGTWLGEGLTEKVHYYKICKETKEILLNHSNSLYDWVYPNLPEDLSFIVKDNYLLVNISHESYGGLFIYDSSMFEKITAIDGLEVEITYSIFYNVVTQGTFELYIERMNNLQQRKNNNPNYTTIN